MKEGKKNYFSQLSKNKHEKEDKKTSVSKEKIKEKLKEDEKACHGFKKKSIC